MVLKSNTSKGHYTAALMQVQMLNRLTALLPSRKTHAHSQLATTSLVRKPILVNRGMAMLKTESTAALYPSKQSKPSWPLSVISKPLPPQNNFCHSSSPAGVPHVDSYICLRTTFWDQVLNK